MIRITLCADDFALNGGVSAAIIKLAEMGRLSAISCLAASPRWTTDSTRLTGLAGRCDLGLHVALTDLAPLGPMPWGEPPPLGALIRRAQAGALKKVDMKAEIARQLDAFKAGLGRPPDFIDGHQHVHLLPGVREAVFDLFDEGRLDANRTYVRNCFEPPAWIVRRGGSVAKAMILSALARPSAVRMRRMGLACNDSFRGVNPFKAGSPVRPMFRRFLSGPGARPLIMCHPGFPDSRVPDPIAARRPEEAAYLESDGFMADMRWAGAELGRFALTPRASM